MSWRDYDEDGVPLWNQAYPREVQQEIERNLRFRIELAKHGMPANEYPNDKEVTSENDKSVMSRVTDYLKNLVTRK